MLRMLMAVMVVLALAGLASAQDAAAPAQASGWQKSANGYVWVGSRYWGGIANASFDEREVVQGGVNLTLQKGSTQVVLKTWASLSSQTDADGRRWTGNAQEFDLGVDVVRQLPRGWRVKAGYSHFFLTKSAGSDVEMLVISVSKAISLKEKDKLVVGVDTYQFVPTSSQGPAAGRFLMPSVAYTRTLGSKWTAGATLAAGFNSAGAFGLQPEPTLRLDGQLLYKLPKGVTGPTVTVGGAPGSTQRSIRTTFGWMWAF